RLEKPRENVRVQSVDAEEVFHEPAEREAATRDFAAYARSRRGLSKHPVKFGTPAGEAAKAWMVEVISGLRTVRLECEEQGRDRDGFGRRLVHVFVSRGGKEWNVGEELVRAGWSPYFTKYGRSERYDARFRAAQAEAKAQKRGIWGDAVAHYTDYDER